MPRLNNVQKLRKNASLASVAAAAQRDADGLWREYREYTSATRANGTYGDYRTFERADELLDRAVKARALADHLTRLAG